MIKEDVVRRASLDSKFDLEDFPEFVGTGVIPVVAGSDDLAVAVYVSKPSSKLSATFKSRVPKYVQVKDHGRRLSIPTRIVDVGHLEPH